VRVVEFDGERDLVPPPWFTRYTVGRGRVEPGGDGPRLVTEDAAAGVLADAQIDDYHGRPRDGLPWAPPLRLTVRARWSHARDELRGTTGFGFWNDPLDGTGRFVAAPSCLWFFHASAPSRLRLRDAAPGDGFVAGAMRGGTISRALLLAGNVALRAPGVDRLAARLGERRIGGGDLLLPPFDLTGWHEFSLAWDEGGARFGIDGTAVAAFGPAEAPPGPLGFVAWIDNNWTALDADGRHRGGRIAAPGRQWLELARVVIATGGGR
jgi:hypothetical protein